MSFLHGLSAHKDWITEMALGPNFNLLYIGVGRFRILGVGGQGLEYWGGGGQGGAKFPAGT